MPSQADPILSLLNSSGFLLQLALEAAVPTSTHGGDWTIIREHPWSISESSGFVDLIIRRGRVNFVVECKRPKGGVWLFPIPSPKKKLITRSTLFWIDYEPRGKDLFGFGELHQAPSTYESDMCVIRGQAEEHRPLLERLASTLVLATESVGRQELSTYHNLVYKEFSVYIPVIVTSAKLIACEVDPAEVDLASGEIRSVSAEEVPIIRFRKNLSVIQANGATAASLEAANKENQRSVFVVNSKAFGSFLKDWSEISDRSHRLRPWDEARALEARSGQSGGA